MKIVDLAEDLTRLSGLEPHEDVEIVFTGFGPVRSFSRSS